MKKLKIIMEMLDKYNYQYVDDLDIITDFYISRLLTDFKLFNPYVQYKNSEVSINYILLIIKNYLLALEEKEK